MKDIAPSVVRVMLTGYADQDIAMDAVNEGAIFRFLTKPCEPEKMLRVLLTAIEQHRLMHAEKELLEKTLTGSLRVLTEVLELTNPVAFAHARRIQNLAVSVARALGIENLWELETAAMLLQVGCVSVPEGVLKKHYCGDIMEVAEQEMVAHHTDLAQRLLRQIPRMETIGAIIGESGGSINDRRVAHRDRVAFLGNLLRTVTDYDLWVSRGLSHQEALERLQAKGDVYSETIVGALVELEDTRGHFEERELDLLQLSPGMIFADELRTEDGCLLVPKGLEVTEAVCHRLANFRKQSRVEERVRVLVPLVKG